MSSLAVACLISLVWWPVIAMFAGEIHWSREVLERIANALEKRDPPHIKVPKPQGKFNPNDKQKGPLLGMAESKE